MIMFITVIEYQCEFVLVSNKSETLMYYTILIAKPLVKPLNLYYKMDDVNLSK